MAYAVSAAQPDPACPPAVAVRSHRRLAAVLLVATLLAATGALAQLRRGDVVVSQGGSLLRLDPETGVVMPLVGAPLRGAVGVLVTPDGDVVVADWMPGGVPTLWRVDPLAGSVAALRTGAPMATPFALAAGPNGRVVFADIDSGSQVVLPNGVVFRQGVLYDLDVATGALQTRVPDCCGWNPTALVVDGPSHAWAVDPGCCAYGADGGIASVDLDAGTWTPLPVSTTPKDPFGIVVDPITGDLVYTEAGYPQGAIPAVLRVAPTGGMVTTIASGPPFRQPLGMVVDDATHVLVADGDTVHRVGLADGVVTPVATGPPLEHAQALARFDVGARVAGRPPRDTPARICAEHAARDAARLAVRLLRCRGRAAAAACTASAVRRFAATATPGCDPCIARNRASRGAVLDGAFERLVGPLLAVPGVERRCAARLLRGLAADVVRRAAADGAAMLGAPVPPVDDGAALGTLLAGAGCPPAVRDAAAPLEAAAASIVDASNGAWYCAR